MASPTKTKRLKSKRKHRRAGKKRKRREGAASTPKFPIHVEDRPDAVLPQFPRRDRTR